MDFKARMAMHPEYDDLCELADKAASMCDALRHATDTATVDQEYEAMLAVRDWSDKHTDIMRDVQNDIFAQRRDGIAVDPLTDKAFFATVSSILMAELNLEAYELKSDSDTLLHTYASAIEAIEAALWAQGVPYAECVNWHTRFQQVFAAESEHEVEAFSEVEFN